MILDIRTLVLMHFIINLANVCAIAIVWHQNRKVFAGLFLLLLDMILQAAGFLLVFFRVALPAMITIVLANIFIISGAFLVLLGLERFFGAERKHVTNYILIVVFALALTYFAVIRPDLGQREICISLMVGLITSQTSWLLLHKVHPSFRKIARFSGIVFFAYAAVSLARMILLIVYPIQTSDLFKSGHIDSLSIAAYLTLSVLVTMSLILLVNTRLLAEVQFQEKKYNKTFQSAPYAILLTRMSDGKIFEVNEGFEEISGYKPEEVVGKTTLGINIWRRDEDRVTVVNELSKGNDVRGFEMQFRIKNGESITGLMSSTVVLINNESCILTTVSDITEQTLLKQKLQDMAMHDGLTGLPNRLLFYDRFQVAAANAQRKNKKLAILSLDLDLFKNINDEYGHTAGDTVLVAASGRLTALLRKVDTVARFGGDEFVLLIWDVSQKQDVIKVVDTIQEGLSLPIVISKHSVKISSSIGIAIYPDDGDNIDSLLKKSDEAMYDIKKNGRDSYLFYSTAFQ